MSETILKIEDLQVRYGGIEAVKGISFDVQQGQIVTLIGSNGAGKSSTLRTISGLVKPSGGKITFQGEDITGKDPTQIVTQGVTLVPEGRRIFPDMTVLENLKIGAYLRHFHTSVVCCFPNGNVLEAEGDCHGTIAYAPQGENGFGYDPVFFVPELRKTFAQLTPEEKNAISHRGVALRAFGEKLKEYMENH